MKLGVTQCSVLWKAQRKWGTGSLKPGKQFELNQEVLKCLIKQFELYCAKHWEGNRLLSKRIA